MGGFEKGRQKMKKNVFLTLTGIETIVVGLYLAFERHVFQDDPHDKFVHVSQRMGDINWAVILITIGVMATVIGMTKFNRWHAQSIMMIILSGLWCAYFVVFLIQDIHFPMIIQLKTIMTGFVFAQILVEARFGGGEQ